MTSMHKYDNIKKDQKIRLGKKTDSGYEYSSRIDFKEDLSIQISKLIQEKKAKDELDAYIKKIAEISSQFKNKEKNLNYYSTVGKVLSFLDSANFRIIKPYSVFRRIVDEIPDILPKIDAKRTQDHLMMMYRVGGLNKSLLDKATWDQWYEISKFKNVISNPKTLEGALRFCKDSSGPELRRKIQVLLTRS